MSKTNFKKPNRKRSSLGDTPPGNEDKPIIQNLHKKSSTDKERIHFHISPERKRQVKMWAVMNDKDMTTIILEALDLWEQAYAKK